MSKGPGRVTGDVPETRYAKSGDVNIAYQVLGDGPVDLVYVPGWVSNLEVAWEHPGIARYFRRLAAFSRLILFDKRGTGLSDRVPPDRLPTLEQRMDDVRAVMDEVGSERAVVMGHSEGGNMCVLFAATYPERTEALITFGIYVKRVWSPDYPVGADAGGAPAMAGHAGARVGRDRRPVDDRAQRGGRRSVRAMVGAVPADERGAAGGGRARADEYPDRRPRRAADDPGADPGPAQRRRQRREDRRGPLHRSADPEREAGRASRERTTSRGRPALDAMLDEVEAFVTGERPRVEPDRVLATVLFTDIVDSTAWVGRLGDAGWRARLEEHQRMVRAELEQYRGREVKTTGDGFLATFDGPARAIRCARGIRDGAGKLGLAVRAGVHAGECEVMGEDVGGIAVHIAARVLAEAAPGEVMVSRTVKDLVAGSGLEFEDRGERELKGLDGSWRLFAVA